MTQTLATLNSTAGFSGKPEMGSKKRKRGLEREKERRIHPKNRYADNPPDFSLLSSLYPSFSLYVTFSPRDGRPFIDWSDFHATRELTRVLLLHDHALTWWIPDGQLCPTVPNRSNYIHWIEDLLESDIIEKNNVDGDKIRGFDIGTGANCIYPLLGASLLGWSFVGSDVTDVALEWAEKNVKSNPHISELIEIRRVCVSNQSNDVGVVASSDSRSKDIGERKEDAADLAEPEVEKLEESAVISFENRLCDEMLINYKQEADSAASRDDNAEPGPTKSFDEHPNVNSKQGDLYSSRDDNTEPGPSTPYYDHSNGDKGYHGPRVLVGVVNEGERFDFCMCNPPFFESMDEAGLNPRTSCGGTPEEMVCPGGEKAFISRIIDDSVTLKDTFRWYTSMVGKKSNLKVLMSKLREVGVTIVKTTEFVQGKTCRWGLAWSFMPPAKRLVSSHVVEKSNLSFMLEGLQRQANAFTVFQSVESFFNRFGATCKSNSSSFTVDVSATNNHCAAISKTDVKNLDETSPCPYMAEASGGLNCSLNRKIFSFWISLFQQIPGTLLVRGSLQQKDIPHSGAFTTVFRQLEEFLKHKFCREKARVTHVSQSNRR